MLYKETIEPRAFQLLRKLCEHSQFSAFSLAGGTNLALRFGHRKSEDLDFFTPKKFSERQLDETIATLHPGRQIVQAAYQTRTYFIQSIKVEFLSFPYPLLAPVEKMEGVRLFSIEDTAAAKLNAIAQRGAKKDFYDLHRLLQDYTPSHLLNMYKKKFGQSEATHLMKSMIYFQDAEDDIEPQTFTSLSWQKIKKDILKAVLNPEKKLIRKLGKE